MRKFVMLCILLSLIAFCRRDHHSQALVSGQDTKKKSGRKAATSVDEWDEMFGDDDGVKEEPVEVSRYRFCVLFVSYITL